MAKTEPRSRKKLWVALVLGVFAGGYLLSRLSEYLDDLTMKSAVGTFLEDSDRTVTVSRETAEGLSEKTRPHPMDGSFPDGGAAAQAAVVTDVDRLVRGMNFDDYAQLTVAGDVSDEYQQYVKKGILFGIAFFKQTYRDTDFDIESYARNHRFRVHITTDEAPFRAPAIVKQERQCLKRYARLIGPYGANDKKPLVVRVSSLKKFQPDLFKMAIREPFVFSPALFYK